MDRPVILWLRRDLRLGDHPALVAALDGGCPVLPVFVLEPHLANVGAASLWRLEQALRVFDDALRAMGSRLILRRGAADQVLGALIADTGAGAVHWSRRYDPEGAAIDREIKASLKDQGVLARSHAGFLLTEPWSVQTQSGTPFRVFTPYWRAMRLVEMGDCLAAPAALPSPKVWPPSDRLQDWNLSKAMVRGAAVVARHACIGEAAALERLQAFQADKMPEYPVGRDQMGQNGTSCLAENLTWGEISPRLIWTTGRQAMAMGNPGAESFIRQLAWRDFAWSLYWHRPDMDRVNWATGWDGFPWRQANADLTAWQRGQTGEPIVDAAMRSLYVTGRMHNRARMIVASYLTKHLMVDWREGLAWFADCLTDWDPAANAMGWQWVAGSGPDAAPFFRVFNPGSQAEKFDPNRAFRRRWSPDCAEFHAAVPKSWGLNPMAPPPMPIIDLNQGRLRALDAYAAVRSGQLIRDEKH